MTGCSKTNEEQVQELLTDPSLKLKTNESSEKSGNEVQANQQPRQWAGTTSLYRRGVQY